ncbi:hypothetical protein AVEN_164592-1 [Araneus ventricosus]|uniref:Uncharacterized protein n=1 Tax=Araneus ventricosus TaxID=182803 RepID=A0A4Y2B5V5_ARAVE|nr:hypothetical protein AVEN_164592-1 [Araneus ventricosus]
MRNSRSSGPPSTLSGSSSGRGLVAGSHISRVPPPSVFVPGDQEKSRSKGRTKVILILGIALPVLACIIGVAAWAVTTDVLRINPRPHDNPYNRYGHQGKTRIDSFQNRNDQDIDVFQLNSISSKISTVPPVILKVVTQKIKPKTTSSPTQTFVESATAKNTSENPNVSDIISRLISDMPIPKNPKNFVIFAPVADEPKDMPKGRRFDGKLVLHDGDDLMAEESVLSEEFSQEIPDEKVAFSRRRKSSRENSAYLLAEANTPDVKQNLKMRSNRKPHAMHDNGETDYHPKSSKRHLQNEQIASTLKSNSISNRKGGVTQPLSVDKTDEHDFRYHEQFGAGPHPVYHDARPQYEQSNFNKIAGNLQSQYPSQNQANSVQIPPSNLNPNKGSNTFRNAPQNPPPPNIRQQHQQKISHGQRMPSQSQSLPGPPPSRQLFHKPPPILGQPPLPPATQNSPAAPFGQHLSSQSHPQSQDFGPPPPHPPQVNPSFHHSSGQPPTYHPPPPPPPPSQPLHTNQSPLPLSFANNNLQHSANSFQSDMSNNGPQYFAPPPQTFHTKTSYDRPSHKGSSGSSLASYERVAQSTVGSSKDGQHHHHHHHHHHEPAASNSDPIGDVNLSDVPRTNDADRLGSIGIGLGPPPRGITVQIGGGGGGGGGGLGGLLPLGALGVARNIVASLLPRPSLGMNSKLYFGVEVGKGGGGLGLLG